MMLALCRFNTGSAAFETAIGFIRENAQAEFCLTLSIFPPHPPWTAPRENLERFAGKTEYPTHYAMVNRVDQTAGRVLAELDRLRLRERTIVDPDYFDAWIFAPILEKAGLKIRFHDMRHRADSPVMPTVFKGDSPACRLAGVPCLADKRKSA